MENDMTRQLLITYVSLSTLMPDPKNPRVHTPRQVRQISRSLQTFGFIVPILVDASYRIIAGHGRSLAAQLLRVTEVPIIMIEHLTPAQLKAFQIADNALSENSDWAKVQLGLNLKELSVENIDLLEITGLDTAVIDLAIEQFEASAPGDDDPGDRILEKLDDVPVSKLGDIWEMDKHRLMCGDARNLAHFKRLMGKRKAHAAFVDIPYNVRIAGHVSGKGSVVHREFEMASGEMSPGEYTEFVVEGLSPLAAFCVDGSLHFVCSDSQHVGEVLAAGREVYDCLKAWCVWVKDNAGMGSLYRSQHEMILVFKNGTAPHRNNVELGRHGRSRTNVWTYPGANSFSGRKTDEGNLLALHPTVKPVQLVADAILDCTARGDIVIDSFIGSGSTLIAAERLGRACYGMEIDPLYVDVAIRRWQRHTGGYAVHASSGKRFDDIAGGAHG
jgi:DNA modification methylase